ncbi:MAG: PLP-dependent transferase [Candidatus Eisenbacteria bacterium]
MVDARSLCQACLNPTLVLADIPRLAEIAHSCGARLVVDSTFAPLVVSPAQHGADVVVHSLTSTSAAGSDLIAGAICASKDFIMELMDPNDGALVLLGATLDARSAFAIRHHSSGIADDRARQTCADVCGAARGVGSAGRSIRVCRSIRQRELLGTLARPQFGLGGVLAVDLGDATKAPIASWKYCRTRNTSGSWR